MVLRGNSGSGKSTVASALQQYFEPGGCLVVPQDRVRREMLGEPDTVDGGNVDLIEVIASWGLDRGLVVVIDGILHAGRYQRMLERLSVRAEAAHFYAWDLEFEETVRRHDQRPQRDEFSAREMADWFHGWQPLDFVDEHRLDASISAVDAMRRISSAIRAREIARRSRADTA